MPWRHLSRQVRPTPGEVHLVGVGGVEGAVEAGHRPHHLERVAVGPHHPGIGVHGVHRIHVPHVPRGLQRPPLGRDGGLQHLQAQTVELIGRHHVAGLEPCAVGVERALGLEVDGLELPAQKRHALGGQGGRHRVHGLHAGGQLGQLARVLHRFGNAGILLVARQGGRRSDGRSLPCQQRSVLRIEIQQVAEQGGAGAGQDRSR